LKKDSYQGHAVLYQLHRM